MSWKNSGDAIHHVRLCPCPSRYKELWNRNESFPLPTDPPRAKFKKAKRVSCCARQACLSRLKTGINFLDQGKRWSQIAKELGDCGELSTEKKVLVDESSISGHHCRHTKDATSSKLIQARRKVSKYTQRVEPITSETSHCPRFASILTKASAVNQA